MKFAGRHALYRPFHAGLAALSRFDAKGGWILSSHVAMSALLALFPFVLFIVALAGSLSQDVDVDNLIELVFGSWPDNIAGPIEAEVRAVVAASGTGLMTLGGGLAIYFASNGVDAVRIAMSRAYHDTDPRPFWMTRLLCVGFVIVGGALVLAAATFGVALPLYLGFFTDAAPPAVSLWFTSDTLTWLLTFGLLLLGVLACHLWLPGLRHPVSQIWPGVLLTVALWIAAVWGFSFYISRFASYSATYAGLAGAMAALIFLYMMSAILILGAEFNGALIDSRDPD